MSEVKFDDELDARGLNCPMPLVKARKMIGSLDPGKVLKIVSTDRGSIRSAGREPTAWSIPKWTSSTSGGSCRRLGRASA